jgi:hypothetical protein
MHVTAVLDAIKKRGHFKDYKKAQKAFEEHKQAMKSAKASPALLNGTSKGSGILRKAKKAKAKAKEAGAKAKEAEGVTEVPEDPMKTAFQADLEKAKKATKDAQGVMTATASEMFVFYSNLHSPKSSICGTILLLSRQKATCL